MPPFDWQGKNVLVTGSAGFLGAWLTEELLQRGASVVALIRDFVPDSRVYTENLADKICIVAGKVEDYPLVERVLNEYEIEIVFHLAAQSIVQTANNNPLSSFESNIKGTWTLLEACRRNEQVKKIIVASSDKAYGDHKALPYTEETPLQGRNPYDVSKSCADLIAQTYSHHFKLPICIARCGNLYGGGDLNFNRLIPGTIRSAYYGESPIIRSNGQYLRDYFYVKDAVRAYLFLADKMEDPKVIGQAFNFGSETKTTVLDMVNEVLAAMDKTDLKPTVLNKAEGEIIDQYLSAKKARETLNWGPTYSVRDGLTETIDWYKNFFESAGR